MRVCKFPVSTSIAVLLLLNCGKNENSCDLPDDVYNRLAITNSGHKVCVWQYSGGIAALIITDGPERNTIQWSPDGINFEIKSYIKGGPPATGLNQAANFETGPVEALKWGLTHQYVSYDDQYIKRFEGFAPFSP